MHSSAILFASFALPLVAFGAAAVAAGVPVLIHLLSRQRYQIVPWAAIRFLMAGEFFEAAASITSSCSSGLI